MKFKIPSEEKKRIINDYLLKGLSPSEIAKILGISRQLVRYWILRINKEKNK
jgi:transposase-like protein